MKKFFLIAVTLVFLLSFAACSTIMAEYAEIDDSTSPLTGIFCVAHLNEGEVLTVAIHGFHITHPSVDELASGSTDVVRVEVLDERIEWINIALPPEDGLVGIDEELAATYYLHVVYSVRVLEVFQGNAEVGDIVEVMQMGGRLDNVEVINDDMIPFALGDDLVLFLITFDFVEGLPSILSNPVQSVYRYAPSIGRAMAANANAELENVHPDNHLTLTLEDLAQMRAR